MTSALEIAAMHGDLESLAASLEADPEGLVRRYGPRRLTLLMLASIGGHAATVRYLLGAGAEPNAVNDNNETALILAASRLWPEVARVLVAAGAHVGYRDASGMTALQRAVLGIRRRSRSAIDTVRILLEAGADASARDEYGRLPHEAARFRRWAWTVPVLGWELSGWYRVGRHDELVKMLEDAAAAGSR
jgi:ankyrin repeat protein